MERLGARLVVLAALGLFLLGAAGAEPKARRGPVSVLEVQLDAAHTLRQLVDDGFDIESASRFRATVYATEGEVEQLRVAGYEFVKVGVDPSPEKALGVYHTYASLTADLQAYAGAHSSICRLASVGTSVQGRTIWGLLVTDQPDIEEAEPEIKYVGAIHGNEPVGMELCLYFADLLLAGYGVDPRITGLVDSTAIWIVPLMNPDGLELGTRYNALGYDLNRSFPAYPDDFSGTIFHGNGISLAGYPKEVVAVAEWTMQNNFTLSAGFHGGALVVNYPYDDDGKPTGVNSPTPDDDLFQAISRVYSVHNIPMWTSTEFDDGITNGAVWYVIDGGMQDWNYRYVSCNDVTIEIGVVKRPPSSELASAWADNQESMLSYAETAHWGIGGVVTDLDTGQPVYAKVEVEGNSHAVFTDRDVGDYHRMLPPGAYTVSVSAPGYYSSVFSDIQVEDGQTRFLDVELMPLTHGQEVPSVGNAAVGLMCLLLSFCGSCCFRKPHRLCAKPGTETYRRDCS